PAEVRQILVDLLDEAERQGRPHRRRAVTHRSGSAQTQMTTEVCSWCGFTPTGTPREYDGGTY
ncbi:hypothetical protein, partial [Klebsiella pneumoniae]|uniref:hypothetical protein n=1 Tax=Klebsiella pneumoniae TaxID=573 RepID=UPI001C55865D